MKSFCKNEKQMSAKEASFVQEHARNKKLTQEDDLLKADLFVKDYLCGDLVRKKKLDAWHNVYTIYMHC